MTGTSIGTVTSAIGYALAIWGGFRLYANTPPEIGMGKIPRIEGDMTEFFDKQEHDIKDRARRSKTGFLFLTIGSCLQMIGTLVAGFHPS